MFRQLPDGTGETVAITIDGATHRVPRAITVAAAALLAGAPLTRTTPVSGAPRKPYCLMGVCFDCLMEIDGVPNQQACMTLVRDGMVVRRQEGAREVKP